MTGDEAESYELFAARLEPSHWFPAANNHVLNSLLIRGFTSVFGLSHLSVRAPAIVGAFLYIWAAYVLCRIVSLQWRVRIPLFVCLVYNPFLFDFFVAARGYGLAVGLLICSIALVASSNRKSMTGARSPVVMVCIAASLAITLSFAANFSFALVDATALLMLVLWTLWTERRVEPAAEAVSWWRVIAAYTIPALLVILLLPSWTMLHWPKGQLWDGAKSLRETFSTVSEASLYQLNPNITNPLLFPILTAIKEYLIPVTCGLAAIQAVFIAVSWKKLKDRHEKWLTVFGMLVSAILAVSVLEHWLAFRFFHLLLPRHRTASYLAPLCTLLVGIVASVGAASRMGKLFRTLLLAMLCILGSYYMLCLRLTYFREWQYQADIRDVYAQVACYNRAAGVRDVEVSWYYHAGMNFYRLLSGRETFNPFSSSTPHRTTVQLYVLNIAFEKDFIESQKLDVVYRGKSTDIIIAVRPELTPVSTGQCYVPPE